MNMDPGVCTQTTEILTPLCAMAPMLDLTTWWFLVDSLPINPTYLGDSDLNFKWAQKLFHFTCLC